MVGESEAIFEKKLVSYLTGERVVEGAPNMMLGETVVDTIQPFSQQLWKYEPTIKTTEDLWDNFKHILEQRNGIVDPLSKTEFDQVKAQITALYSPYQAGQFLYGLDGRCQIEINLDNGEHKYLNVFDQNQIGAGDTHYQVVTQIQRPPKINGKRPRRFDTTLLINGLPMIQIEEKKDTRDINEALRQMEEYICENQYSDIFSTVQILVAMTPNDIKYMANTTKERFNTDFAFRWQTLDGKAIRHWREFANLFLSIPMAHKMSTNYMILEGTKNHQMIKVMRPYQVYATEAVIKQVKNLDFSTPGPHRLGYVWHTTGSGKTITSFKTAWLASRLPNVEKVVFLVDRIALTNQTMENYCAYDPTGGQGLGNTVAIQDTQNTRELVQRLKSRDSSIVVTSSQKLGILADEWEKKGNPVADKRILFIVDEAHRSTRGKSFATIQRVFRQSAWVGYTGTPMFEAVVGANNTDTEDIFGPPLHEYTIREAISDRNVLGFKVDFKTTISEEEMRENYLPAFYREQHPTWTEEDIQEKIKNLTPEDMDDQIKPTMYDGNLDHIKIVVKDIFDGWKNRSNNGKYNALLTTNVGGGKSSIPMAIAYFDEFWRVNEEREAEGKFTLKVGITFSMSTDNRSGQASNNEGLDRAIKRHNALFGTSFNMQQVPAYTEDVMARLAKRAEDGKYYDLVIVVEQLLTGFDAPELNTLYVDRTLKNADLIQAYSRTNRISNMQEKPWGRVINYRWPKHNERLMNEALSIYANKQSVYRQERLIDEGDNGGDLVGILAKPFAEQLAEVQEVVNTLNEFTDAFTEIPRSEAKQEEMLNLLHQFSGGMAKLKQYPPEEVEGQVVGFDYENPDALIHMIGMSPEQHQMLTVSLYNEVKEVVAARRGISVIQLNFSMTHIKDVKVNYDYLTELVQDLLNQVHKQDMEAAAITRDKISAFALGLEDRQQAKEINAAADLIQNGGYVLPDGDYPVQLTSADAIIQGAVSAVVDKKIESFIRAWGIGDVTSIDELKKLFEDHMYGDENDLNERNQVNDLMRLAKNEYGNKATDDSVRALSWIKFRTGFKSAIYQLADDIVGADL